MKRFYKSILNFFKKFKKKKEGSPIIENFTLSLNEDTGEVVINESTKIPYQKDYWL